MTFPLIETEVTVNGNMLIVPYFFYREGWYVSRHILIIWFGSIYSNFCLGNKERKCSLLRGLNDLIPFLVSGCIGGGEYLVDVKNKKVNQVL